MDPSRKVCYYILRSKGRKREKRIPKGTWSREKWEEKAAMRASKKNRNETKWKRERTSERERKRNGGKETKGDCHSRGNEWVGSYLRGILKHQAFIKCIGHSSVTKQTPLPLPNASVLPVSLFFFFFYFLPSISASAYHDITKIRESSRNSAPLNLPCISRVLPT